EVEATALGREGAEAEAEIRAEARVGKDRPARVEEGSGPDRRAAGHESGDAVAERAGVVVQTDFAAGGGDAGDRRDDQNRPFSFFRESRSGNQRQRENQLVHLDTLPFKGVMSK